jgi:hypothetical protein
MISSIGEILLTAFSFLLSMCIVVIGYVSILIEQVWTLACQSYHLVTPYVTSVYQWLMSTIA